MENKGRTLIDLAKSDIIRKKRMYNILGNSSEIANRILNIIDNKNFNFKDKDILK